MNSPLPEKFYLQPTAKVAQKLLGKLLVHVLPNGERLSGIIVETEAYLGHADPGAHVFGGRRTERVKSMYKQGGHAYVYFTYGNHYCINAVTQKQNVAEGVLIRALEPREGLDRMMKNRATRDVFHLTSGPGKVCRALGIDKRLDGTSLSGPHLFIEDMGNKIKTSLITTSSRIGLGCKHEAAKWPLRFYIRNNPHVSKRDRAAEDRVAIAP